MAKLADAQVRNAKPKAKPYKLSDGHGLWLHVTPSGGKLWRWRYERDGAEQTLSLGHYPALSLAAARLARDDARATLKGGVDPNVAKRIKKAAVIESAANTFELIAREWYANQRQTWTEIHAREVLNSLEKDVFPTIGLMPIQDIKAPIVLALLRLIENRPAVETARRIRQRISSVFQYAIASGKTDTDSAAMVKKALKPIDRKKQAAVLEIGKARELLRAVDSQFAHPVTKLANRLLALTALRPGALRMTTWAELKDIDSNDPIWRVPATRMKLRKKQKDSELNDHYIPLSRQAIETLEALRSLTGNGKYVFPGRNSPNRPMSENTINKLLKAAGYEGLHVPHGWRSTFSTVMNERNIADAPIIDLMIAHKPKGKVEAAYNRSLHMPRRKQIAQEWADFLLEGATPIIEIINGIRH